MTDIMELFQKYKDDVYRLAVSYTHSVQEAEDVCQTVFLKLMEQKSIMPGKEKAWLLQVTANQCKSLLRSARWRKTESLEEKTIMFEKPEQEDVWEAVMKLKPGYRAVIYLYYCEEYSAKEIAGLLKIKESAVTTRLSRARQILKKELKEV